MKKIVSLGMILVCGVALVGCGNKSSSPTKSDSSTSVKEQVESNSSEKKQSENKTIKTENGSFTIDLGNGWEEIEATELNDDADISLENDQKMMYATILSESEEDFTDFDTFKNSVDFRDTLGAEDVSETEINQDGWQGNRYNFVAAVDGVKLFYIYDIVKSDKGHFVQKISWTLNSKKDANKENLESILDSFKDVSE